MVDCGMVDHASALIQHLLEGKITTMPPLRQWLPTIDTTLRSFIITYRVYIFVIIISFITLFQGFTPVDTVYPHYLSMIINHNSADIPAVHGYLLEGLLG